MCQCHAQVAVVASPLPHCQSSPVHNICCFISSNFSPNGQPTEWRHQLIKPSHVEPKHFTRFWLSPGDKTGAMGWRYGHFWIFHDEKMWRNGPTAPCRQKISETMKFAGHWPNCTNSKYCRKGRMISDGLKQQNDEETNIDP